MTSKELLAKCTERDQQFLDYFHPRLWDLKSFTEQIEFKVPYTYFLDYHIVITKGTTETIIHIFTIEARYEEDAQNFFQYLKDEVIDIDISSYHILRIANTDYYQITISIKEP